jgi:hypothetical protein
MTIRLREIASDSVARRAIEKVEGRAAPQLGPALPLQAHDAETRQSAREILQARAIMLVLQIAMKSPVALIDFENAWTIPCPGFKPGNSPRLSSTVFPVTVMQSPCRTPSLRSIFIAAGMPPTA